MFDRVKISDAMYGIVGLRNPANPTYAVIDADNQTSRSGYYVTDNALCKVEFIKDNQNYLDADDAQFNDFLKTKQKSAIIRVMDRVFDNPDFIDRQVLYQNTNNKTELETLPNGFIGYEINLTLEKNWSFEISRAILEFEGTGDVEILLWNSAIPEPIYTTTVNIVSPIQEVSLNWRIDNTNIAYKGKWFFGYVTQGTLVTPFKREYESADIMSRVTGMDWDKIEVPGHSDNLEIFNLDDIENTDVYCGINPDITVFEDYTDLILQNQFLFAEAVNIQFTIDLLSEILASNRFNQNQRHSEDMLADINVEIEGIDVEHGIKKIGLKRELTGSVSNIKKEIRRLKKGYFANGYIVNTLT